MVPLPPGLSSFEAIAFIETALERPMPLPKALPAPPKPGGRAKEESEEVDPDGVKPLGG